MSRCADSFSLLLVNHDQMEHQTVEQIALHVLVWPLFQGDVELLKDVNFEV